MSDNYDICRAPTCNLKSRGFFVWRNVQLILANFKRSGELAQMGERSLSMREVPGSIPGFSNDIFPVQSFFFFLILPHLTFVHFQKLKFFYEQLLMKFKFVNVNMPHISNISPFRGSTAWTLTLSVLVNFPCLLPHLNHQTDRSSQNHSSSVLHGVAVNFRKERPPQKERPLRPASSRSDRAIVVQIKSIK